MGTVPQTALPSDGIVFRGTVNGFGGFTLEVHEVALDNASPSKATVKSRAFRNPTAAFSHYVQDPGTSSAALATSISNEQVTCTSSLNTHTSKVHIFVFGPTRHVRTGQNFIGNLDNYGGLKIEMNTVTLASGAGSHRVQMWKPRVSLCFYRDGQTPTASEAFSTLITTATKTVTIDSSAAGSTKKVRTLTIGHGA